MTTSSANRVRIVGCGRWLRRDDQVGLLVVEAIRQGGSLPADIVLTEAPGAELADALEECDVLLLVDAAAADARHPPGSWQMIDYCATPERVRTRSSNNTHTLGVDSALRLSAMLGTLPRAVMVFAIAVANVEQGDAVTPQVRDAVPAVADAMIAEARRWASSESWESQHA